MHSHGPAADVADRLRPMNTDFSDTELLTAADERELARRIEAGVLARHLLETGQCPEGATTQELGWLVADGEAAWQRFFEANLRLVVEASRPWAVHVDSDVDDVFQEGCLGLAEALRRYDYRRGLKFSTFAWKWITKYASRAAALHGGRIPMALSRVTLMWRVRRVAADLESGSGMQPSIEAVAQKVSAPVETVAELLAWRPPVVLDPQVAVEVVAAEAEEPASPIDLSWLSKLAPRERHVLMALYGFEGEPVGLSQLAEELGVSVSTVRRMKIRALDAGRAHLNRELACAA